MSRDFAELLASLNDHNVEYLIVGSTVLAFLGRPRYTEDLDIWVRATEKNIDLLGTALESFGAPLNRERLAEMHLAKDKMIVLGAAPTAVDILNQIKGLDFDDAWANRSHAELFGVKVPILGRDDFVRSKRAAGRAKDLADLAILAEAEGSEDP